ncbi:MAG: hypothetical protein Q8O55_04025 [Dehalococcoidales bacterium]|nr:hypothetical protein [Dehalococcoidales bacterium]
MKGILFKPDMIKAIVDGLKSQTRRVIKPQPVNADYWTYHNSGAFYPNTKDADPKLIHPRYQVGNVVYIKEAYYAYGFWRQFTECDKKHWEFFQDDSFGVYYPDTKPSWKIAKHGFGDVGWYKRSPLFLPEKYARYFIKITDVRTERLQEITEEDAIAEGILLKAVMTKSSLVVDEPSYVTSYAMLWDFINKDYQWGSNPFVWHYEFELNKEARK